MTFNEILESYNETNTNFIIFHHVPVTKINKYFILHAIWDVVGLLACLPKPLILLSKATTIRVTVKVKYTPSLAATQSVCDVIGVWRSLNSQ